MRDDDGMCTRSLLPRASENIDQVDEVRKAVATLQDVRHTKIRNKLKAVSTTTLLFENITPMEVATVRGFFSLAVHSLTRIAEKL